MTMLALTGALAATSITLSTVAPSGMPPLSVVAATLAVLSGVGTILCLGEALAACLVVVRLSAYAVEARAGLLPLGGLRIPVCKIRNVRVIESPARPWNGLGWWWMARPAYSVLVRSGPALALQLNSGREVFISIDQPHEAAGILRRIVNPQPSIDRPH